MAQAQAGNLTQRRASQRPLAAGTPLRNPVGLGFRESISASCVTQSLAVETVTVVALLSWTILVTAAPRPRTHTPRESSSRLLKI
jgi:hypothetical protein